MGSRAVVLICLVVLSLAAAHPAAAGPAVPIKGAFATYADFVVPPPANPPFACPVSSGGQLLGWVRVQGTGKVSHLGVTTFDNFQCLWADATGQHLYGEADFVAANGNTLAVSYDGDVVPVDPTNIVFGGTMTFSGGTGRFAGATGKAPYGGGYSFVTKRGYIDPLAGWISSVGSSKR